MKWRAVGFLLVVGVFAVGLAVSRADHYRARVHSGDILPPVLVAKQLIPKGTAGSIVATQQMYAPTTLRTKDIDVGAIYDPSYLMGRVAAVDVTTGQQLTEIDFAPRQLHDAGHGG